MREINAPDREEWELLNQLVTRFSDFALRPIASGLLYHLLVKESVKRTQYSKGVFVIADVLCEAAELQRRKGEPVNLDIYEFSDLRKRHLPSHQLNECQVQKAHNKEQVHA